MSFHRVLVAVDSDPTSLRALSVAASLAKELGAALTLVHVWEPPAYAYGTRALISGDELLASAQDGAQRELDLRLVTARVEVPAVRGVLRRGDPATEIVAEILASGHDLIVMGTHGRHGVERAVLGSVAGTTVRYAPVPVLVVGPQNADRSGS